MLKQNCALTYLDLSHNRMDMRGAGLIVQALKCNLTLVKLGLSNICEGSATEEAQTVLFNDMQTELAKNIKLAADSITHGISVSMLPLILANMLPILHVMHPDFRRWIAEHYIAPEKDIILQLSKATVGLWSKRIDEEEKAEEAVCHAA